MSTPTVKSCKVYAVIESVIELPTDFEDVRGFLKEQKFSGEFSVNHHQGGVTSVVTREKISLSMAELDKVIHSR